MTKGGTSPLSVTVDLEEERLAIEASAGTGKTHALVDLVTRYLTETDRRVNEVLIVTFTRAATSQVRARVRDRLVEARKALELVVAPTPSGEVPAVPTDPFLAHLIAHDCETRLARVVRAVRDFDTCTITTIHGFASQVLGSLGSASGIDPDATLSQDDEELCASASADVLAGAALMADPSMLPSYTALRNAVSRASAMPDVELAPYGEEATDKELLMTALVDQTRKELVIRRQRQGTRSYTDLLTNLWDALKDREDPAALQALRDRYRVALIDEFQDTDDVQWNIFRELFACGQGSQLVVVGDDKQAIYSFRGADVHTYRRAVEGPPTFTPVELDVNWRSDSVLLRALNVLFENAAFGDRIDYTLVTSSSGHEGSRLVDTADDPLPPLRIRLAIGSDFTHVRGGIQVHEACHAIYRDMAVQVRALLDGGYILGADSDQQTAARVKPKDVAVLVRTGAEATDVQAELLAQGVPAVLARGQSVLDSPSADQWRWLLWSLLRPSDPRRARTFAITWFGGLTPEELAAMSESDLGSIQLRMEDLVETLARRGVTSFVRRVLSEGDVLPRVLRFPDGDRVATDLEHIGELLQSAAPLLRSGLAGLLSVIDTEPTGDADTEQDVDELTARRIESEEDAVQIMTVWVAKGLEFPIVCCPTLWRPGISPDWVSEENGTRTFQVVKSTTWKSREDAKERAARASREALGERFRLAYVALTRARHQTIVWWSHCQGSNKTALTRLLFARDAGVLDPDAYWSDEGIAFDESSAKALLDPLIALSGGTISVDAIGVRRRPADTWVNLEAPGKVPVNELRVAPFDRALDRSRHRWSFTALSTSEESPAVIQRDPADADSGADDEGDRVDDTAEGDSAVPTPSGVLGSPLVLLPAGARFGTLVHSVLEATDFCADDIEEEIDRAITAQQQWMRVDLRPNPELAPEGAVGEELLRTGLIDVLETPLGPTLAGLRLADLSLSARVNEMTFDLRLGTGVGKATLRDVGQLLLGHLERPHAFAEWAGSLLGKSDRVLSGHLTGSIDLIFQTTDGRFVVADYKTNRLNPPGRAPRAGDYGQASMARAMAAHDYPLQALLYSVALHRYLRWRQPGYEPARHLGGAVYLFVRGMSGPPAPGHNTQPEGVFHWDISHELVGQLSDLLNGTLGGVA